MLITIQKAAMQYKIASLRIDSLIRQGDIVKCVQRTHYNNVPEIVVDTDEIDRYFKDNPATLEIWQNNIQITQSSNNL